MFSHGKHSYLCIYKGQNTRCIFCPWSCWHICSMNVTLKIELDLPVTEWPSYSVTSNFHTSFSYASLGFCQAVKGRTNTRHKAEQGLGGDWCDLRHSRSRLAGINDCAIVQGITSEELGLWLAIYKCHATLALHKLCHEWWESSVIFSFWQMFPSITWIHIFQMQKSLYYDNALKALLLQIGWKVGEHTVI